MKLKSTLISKFPLRKRWNGNCYIEPENGEIKLNAQKVNLSVQKRDRVKNRHKKRTRTKI